MEVEYDLAKKPRNQESEKVAEIGGVVKVLEKMLNRTPDDNTVQIVLPRMIRNINHYQAEYHSSVIDSSSFRIEVDLASDRLARRTGISYQEAQQAVKKILRESGLLYLLGSELNKIG